MGNKARLWGDICIDDVYCPHCDHIPEEDEFDFEDKALYEMQNGDKKSIECCNCGRVFHIKAFTKIEFETIEEEETK